MGVEYTRTNPAIAAFNEGMKAAADRRAADVALLDSDLAYKQKLAEAPSRISRVNADARLANTAADVADATKGANIQIQYNTATQGDLRNQDMRVDLGEKRLTSPSRVASVNATNEATAVTAPVEADVKVKTAPYRVQQTQQSAETGAINVKEQQLKFFKETVKLLNEGRVAEAEEIARRTNEKIPDEVKQDAAIRGVLTEAIAEAERRYPNRPNAQFQFIQEATKQAKATGIGNRKPEDRFAPVPAAPPVSEVGSPKNPTAMDQNIDSLIRRGIAKDQTEAFRLLNQSKSDPTATLQRLYDTERKIRLEAAKGPGGFNTIDNATLERIDREATTAAAQKALDLKRMAASMPDIPAGTVGATAAAPAPTVPAPAAPAPAVPPVDTRSRYERIAPFFLGGKAAPTAAAPAGPALSPSGVPDARQYQGPAPKDQGRAPGGAPPPLDPAIAERARSMDPAAVREQARAAIAAGKDREAVISRLQALGISTEGL